MRSGRSSSARRPDGRALIAAPRTDKGAIIASPRPSTPAAHPLMSRPKAAPRLLRSRGACATTPRSPRAPRRGVPRLPARRRRERRGIDLERPDEPVDERAPARAAVRRARSSRTGTANNRAGTPSAAPIARTRSGTDTLSRVGDEMDARRRHRRVERRIDRVDEIADVEQAAAIADRRQRQPPLARDFVEQRREIAFHARAVHQRQAQHDRRHRRGAGDRRELALGVELAARVGVARVGRIVRTERTPGRARLAVDLDRAREHEARHAGAHGGAREPRGRRRRSPPRTPRPDRRRSRPARARARRDARPPTRRRRARRAAVSDIVARSATAQ